MSKLTVNDEEVEGVDVNMVVHRDGGDVEVHTEGNERLVVADSEPAPEPEPEPEPEPDPPTENVLRRYDYTDSHKEQRGYWITIPQGTIVSSEIPAGLSGSVNFQQPSDDKPKFDFWISAVPGGPTISRYCKTDGANFVLSKEFTTGEGFVWSCALDEDKPHYLNIRHTKPDRPESRINRKIYS